MNKREAWIAMFKDLEKIRHESSQKDDYIYFNEKHNKILWKDGTQFNLLYGSIHPEGWEIYKKKVKRWLWAYKNAMGRYAVYEVLLTEQETEGVEKMLNEKLHKLPWSETEFEEE